MQAFSHQSIGRLRCDCNQLNIHSLATHDFVVTRSVKQRPGILQASNAHVEPTAATEAPQRCEDAISSIAVSGNHSQQVEDNRRRARYLTYAEYVELKAQQQQQAANGSGQSPHADKHQQQQPGSDSESKETVKKRVPWNKGRKHTARKASWKAVLPAAVSLQLCMSHCTVQQQTVGRYP